MEQRLAILLQGDVIDQETHDGMLQVVSTLENDWKIAIRHSQGNMALTHMASALMRSRRNEKIEPVDNEILEELKASDNFSTIMEIHQSLLNHFQFKLDPAEEGYLLVNLYSLILANENT